jgi:hypothetical protein
MTKPSYVLDNCVPKTCREVEINILRSSVHPAGFIWKRPYRDTRSTKHNIW